MLMITSIRKDRSSLDPSRRHMIPPSRYIYSYWSCHPPPLPLRPFTRKTSFAEYGDVTPIGLSKPASRVRFLDMVDLFGLGLVEDICINVVPWWVITVSSLRWVG